MNHKMTDELKENLLDNDENVIQLDSDNKSESGSISSVSLSQFDSPRLQSEIA